MVIVTSNETADLSHLSALSNDDSEERIARLAEVAAAILSGQYGVDAQALSARLVEEHLAAELKPRALDAVGAVDDGDGFEIEAPVG
jgi:Anti-sigma-28 factor, FlgM